MLEPAAPITLTETKRLCKYKNEKINMISLPLHHNSEDLIRNRTYGETVRRNMETQHPRSSAGSSQQSTLTLGLVESYEESSYGFLNLESSFMQ